MEYLSYRARFAVSEAAGFTSRLLCCFGGTKEDVAHRLGDCVFENENCPKIWRLRRQIASLLGKRRDIQQAQQFE